MQVDDETRLEMELAEVHVPSSCPAEDCFDRVLSVNRDLHVLFKKFHDVIDTKGPSASIAGRYELDICMYIKGQHRQLEWRNYAEEKGWSTSIDFRALPDRVMTMKSILHRLVFVEGIWSNHVIPQDFIKDLKGRQDTAEKALEKFASSRTAPQIILEKARPG